MSLKMIARLAIVCGCWTLCQCAVVADEASNAAAQVKSPDESVRIRAIDQLSTGGEGAAAHVGVITELLKDPSAKVRAHAAAALGAVGAPAKPAVAALVELLKDPDASVRQQAIKAVMRIRPGPQVMVPLCTRLIEDADPGVRMRVLHAIADVGPAAVPGLIEALKNEQAAYWACVILRDIGPGAKDAVPALAEKLRDSRPEIRREAILALAAMDAAAAPAAEQIAAALTDEHTQTAATYALGRIGRIPEKAEAQLRRNAKSSDSMLSTTSLWVLARIHPDDRALRIEATEQLIAKLKDADPFVRVAAARALSALPPAPEITGPIWEKAMQDADETTARHALDALAALGPKAVPRLIEALKHEKLRDQIAYVLGQIGPAAAPATALLSKLVADKNERVAHEAVLALAKIGPGAKAAVPALIEAIKERDGANAAAIAYALGKIGPDAAAAEPALTDLLESPDRTAAIAGAWALVRIRPASRQIAARTVPVLMAGLSNTLPQARSGAAEALGDLGPLAKQALGALQHATEDSDAGVREAATAAVARVRGS